MKGETCSGLGCTKKVTNTIKWPDAGISIPVCAEHLVAFSSSRMEVSSEVIPEWRRPDRAPAIFASMMDQAEAALAEGKPREAYEAAKLAINHVRNCEAYGIELDSSRYASIVAQIADKITEEGAP